MRILLVEDDMPLSGALANYLRAQQFVVEPVASLAAARTALPLADWSAVLLDLHLPDGDGLSLLPTIRRQAPDTPVIVLTARDQVSDRIRGLDAGADDYLVKPFDPDELLARLRAVQRRGSASTAGTIQLGGLEIDLGRGTVLAHGQPATLTAKEWTLLRVLATRPDRIHSRDTLTHALYGFDDEVGSNTVEVFISSLRRKLGRDSIETLRGMGYRLTGGR